MEPTKTPTPAGFKPVKRVSDQRRNAIYGPPPEGFNSREWARYQCLKRLLIPKAIGEDGLREFVFAGPLRGKNLDDAIDRRVLEEVNRQGAQLRAAMQTGMPAAKAQQPVRLSGPQMRIMFYVAKGKTIRQDASNSVLHDGKRIGSRDDMLALERHGLVRGIEFRNGNIACAWSATIDGTNWSPPPDAA